MRRKATIFGWVLRLLLSVYCIGGHCLTYGQDSFPQVRIPAGSPIPVLLLQPISTQSAVVGQAIMGTIAQDIFVGTYKVLSRSDRVMGQVTRVDPPAIGRNAILQIQFDTLETAQGLRVSIRSWTDTGYNNHVWGGELTEGTVPEIIPYNVLRIGTYGRVLFQGPRAMGTHIDMLPGNRITIVMQEDVRLLPQ